MKARFPKSREAKMKLGAIAVLSLVVILNFQNCAPSNVAGTDAGSGSTVAAFAQKGDGGARFPDARAFVSSGETRATASGTCGDDKAGARLSWELKDVDGDTMAVGQGACDESGAFKIDLQDAEALQCGQDYVVHVEVAGAGRSVSAAVQRLCPPKS